MRITVLTVIIYSDSSCVSKMLFAASVLTNFIRFSTRSTCFKMANSQHVAQRWLPNPWNIFTASFLVAARVSVTCLDKLRQSCLSMIPMRETGPFTISNRVPASNFNRRRARRLSMERSRDVTLVITRKTVYY